MVIDLSARAHCPDYVFRAVAFADIVGSSALAEADEVEAFFTVRRVLRLLRREARAHGGRVVNEAGDGALVEFSRTCEAVRWASKCHLVLEAERRSEHRRGELKLRVGIHAGHVLVHGAQLFGRAIHVACRLQQAASPGETLVSAAACETLSQGDELSRLVSVCVPIKGTDRAVLAYSIGRPAKGEVSRLGTQLTGQQLWLG